MLTLVGAVFISQPADLLAKLTPQVFNVYFWMIIIFIYYLVVTMFPIDKIVGRFYPIFAFSLLFMAVGILVCLLVKWPSLPEMWNGFGTKYDKNPILPMMFISIACGACSGFHASQSPLMARCMKNEKHGLPVFYGAMVAEGIVALIWAAAATAYFGENGASQPAGEIVLNLSKSWLGTVGGILAILGVIVAPITTGDTALRSGRLIIADLFHVKQISLMDRLKICIPLFLATLGVLLFSVANKEGFDILWRYFAWTNQTLACFTLWSVTSHLRKIGKNYMVGLVPSVFMTYMIVCYICIAPEGFELNPIIAYIIAAVFDALCIIQFLRMKEVRHLP